MRFSSFNGLWYLSVPNGLQLKFNPLRGLFLPTLFHSAFPTAHSSLVRQPFHYQTFLSAYLPQTVVVALWNIICPVTGMIWSSTLKIPKSLLWNGLLLSTISLSSFIFPYIRNHYPILQSNQFKFSLSVYPSKIQV